jgi:hypothetical protein
MFRTTISITALLGILLLVSKSLLQISADEKAAIPVLPARAEGNSSTRLAGDLSRRSQSLGEIGYSSNSLPRVAGDLSPVYVVRPSAKKSLAAPIEELPVIEAAVVGAAQRAEQEKPSEDSGVVVAPPAALGEFAPTNAASTPQDASDGGTPTETSPEQVHSDDSKEQTSDSTAPLAVSPTPTTDSPEQKKDSPDPATDSSQQTTADSIETAGAEEELSAELVTLRNELRRCLQYYYRNPENAGARSPWGIMHAALAYGVESHIYANNRRVNAIGWLCWNGPCRGQQMLHVQNGKVQAMLGPGVQGHGGQFLAILAQSKVQRDFAMRVGSYEFTLEDLIEQEKLGCQSGTELTFKLIGLSHYLDPDATWTNETGQTWSIARLIKEELAQPVIGAACGGTHRMMGFSYAVRMREKRGQPVTGQWLRAKKYVESYHEYTLRLQNRDGSFSTQWFEGRGDWGDAERRVQTTGHILEWLVFSLPKERLRDPQVIKAVTYLVNLMNQQHQWEVGPKGHALRALVLYDQRTFGGTAQQWTFDVATSIDSSAK